MEEVIGAKKIVFFFFGVVRLFFKRKLGSSLKLSVRDTQRMKGRKREK